MSGYKKLFVILVTVFLWSEKGGAQAQSSIHVTRLDGAVFQGEALTLHCYCHVQGNAAPFTTLEWLHNGSVVAMKSVSTECTQGSIIPFDLTRDEVEFEDSGSYGCRGKISDGAVAAARDAGVLTVVDPGIIYAPPKQYAVRHTDTILNCSTTFHDSSHVAITWMDSQGKTLTNGEYRILDADRDDEGVYVCDVFISSMNLVVKKKIELFVVVPPVITSTPPTYQEIAAKTPFNLTVNFQSRFKENTTVFWHKLLDDIHIPVQNIETQYINDVDGYTQLVFQKISVEDSGVYRVVIDNRYLIPPELRTAETSFELDVNGLDLHFVNNTPKIVDGVVSAEINYSRPGTQVTCRLKPVDTTSEDCSAGSFIRSNVLPGDYILRVVAKDEVHGIKENIRSKFNVPSTPSFCTAHLINRGVTVIWSSVVVEFGGSGMVTEYTCSLNREEYHPCQSPYVKDGLPEGTHTLNIKPADCGRNARARQIHFKTKFN